MRSRCIRVVSGSCFRRLPVAHLRSLSESLVHLAFSSAKTGPFAPSLIRVAAAGQHPGPVQPAAADADDPRQHAERLQHQQGPEKGRSSESSESFIRVVHVFPRPVWAGSGSLIRVDVFLVCVCARVCACARVRRRGGDVVPSVPHANERVVRARVRACACGQVAASPMYCQFVMCITSYCLGSRPPLSPRSPAPPNAHHPPPYAALPRVTCLLSRAGLSPSLLSPGPSLLCSRGVSRSRGCGPRPAIARLSRSSESLI